MIGSASCRRTEKRFKAWGQTLTRNKVLRWLVAQHHGNECASFLDGMAEIGDTFGADGLASVQISFGGLGEISDGPGADAAGGAFDGMEV